ncbi:MAG: hypothetical protein ACI97K_002146 [Glaciecola sp.]|jgi:hypothetical protein
MRHLANLHWVSFCQFPVQGVIIKFWCIGNQSVCIFKLSAVLAFVFSVSAYAEDTHATKLEMHRQGKHSEALTQIVFPAAPHNTPYKLVAELPYQAPSSIFSYAHEHQDQYAAYWPANHPDKKVNGVVATEQASHQNAITVKLDTLIGSILEVMRFNNCCLA